MNPDSIWQKRKCIFLLTQNEKYGKKKYGYELEHFAEKIVLHSVMHLGQCGIQNYSVALCFSSFYDHKHYRCWRRIIEREQSKIASIPHPYKCTAEWMTIHSPKIIKQLWLVVKPTFHQGRLLLTLLLIFINPFIPIHFQKHRWLPFLLQQPAPPFFLSLLYYIDNVPYPNIDLAFLQFKFDYSMQNPHICQKFDNEKPHHHTSVSTLSNNSMSTS